MPSRDEIEQIPLPYRVIVKIILKLPNPGLPFFIVKHFPEFEGILWSILIPVFFILYFFFNIWLITFLSILFAFPLNIILGLAIPTIIFVFFLRIQIERAILFWKSIHESPKEWKVSEKVEELVKDFKKRKAQDFSLQTF